MTGTKSDKNELVDSTETKSDLEKAIELFGNKDFLEMRNCAVAEKREYGCIITKDNTGYLRIRNVEWADPKYPNHVLIARRYGNETIAGIFHIHYKDKPIWSTTVLNGVDKYITHSISDGDAGSFLKDLLKNSGYYEQISRNGFFSLVLNNRGDYSSFQVTNFQAASTFANTKGLDIDKSYSKLTNAGKSQKEALEAILGPHGIQVSIKE